MNNLITILFAWLIMKKYLLTGLIVHTFMYFKQVRNITKIDIIRVYNS